MITAIIQARVNSNRFPRKILRNLSGKPLIMHVVNAALKSRFIDRVVVATSHKPENDALAEIVMENYGTQW